jgi:hypothetical protein
VERGQRLAAGPIGPAAGFAVVQAFPEAHVPSERAASVPPPPTPARAPGPLPGMGFGWILLLGPLAVLLFGAELGRLAARAHRGRLVAGDGRGSFTRAEDARSGRRLALRLDRRRGGRRRSDPVDSAPLSTARSDS